MLRLDRNYICRQSASILRNVDPPPPNQEHAPHWNGFELESTWRTDLLKHSDASRFRFSTDAPHSSTADHNLNGRKIWVCPHLGLDFDQAKKLFSPAAVAQSQSWKHDFGPCPRKFYNTNLSSYLKTHRKQGGKISNSMNTHVALLQAPSRGMA